MSTSPVGWNPPFSPSSGTAITARFSSAQSFVSIDGLDVGSNGVELDVYDASNNLLGTSTAYGSGAGVGNVVTLSVSAAGIVKADWYLINQNPGDGVLFDNLTYTGATIPEPSSLLLLGSGIAGMAGLLRRKFLS